MTSPAGLMETLREKGTPLGPWADAVVSVRRELFLPDEIEVGDELVSRSTSPARWLEVAYSDVSVTTQVNDGRPTGPDEYRLPTSSSSQPSVMLEMLSLLDVQPTDRILELGSGTGLNAAWLAHRVGSDRVVSVEIDPVLAEQAARNTSAAGLSPFIVRGDGEQGWPAGAPYQRVIATYAVTAIPYAWVEQVAAPQGRIVAPWGGSFFPYSFAVLDVRDGGRAEGRFTGYPAFMRSRNLRPARGFLDGFLHHREAAVATRTSLSPPRFAQDPDALFYAGLALPDAWHLPVPADDGSGEMTLWILADDRESWASADYTPGGRDYAIAQYGPRRLWDEAEAAYRTWEALGRPARDRAGLSVTAHGQQVWLDTPEHGLSALTDAPLTDAPRRRSTGG
ncbi:methyltransferase domain-containing protein [Streptomyces sp. SID5594]|uniref:methyltransferase domain-containing protein n=1 Tax=unclassified Streptomyces TaxID=2593676 RepID=UPI000D0AB927|nr:methyltransferase domain-containing protein [Streptomyces sp. ScaeMP-e10]MZF53906.1 methyltransferase domain-containing protein [Streptomyces sp. SID5594]